jgi:hypothetical protein
MIRLYDGTYISWQEWQCGGGWYTIQFELKEEYDYIFAILPSKNGEYLVLTKYDYIEADHGEEYFGNEKLEDIPDDRKLFIDFEFKPQTGGIIQPNLINEVHISFSNKNINLNKIIDIQKIIRKYFFKFFL